MSRLTAATLRRPHWHGFLCMETRDEIAERMRDVLGDDYFTLVICNSYNEESALFSSVEVHPSQWLTHGISDYQDRSLAGLSWSTPRYAMGVHTEATTQAEGRGGAPHKYVRFSFEPDRFVVDHFAPAGYRLQWTFAVERHDRDDNGGAS